MVMRRVRWTIVALVAAMLGATGLLPATAGADGVRAAWFTNVSYNTSNGGWIDAVTAGDLNTDGRNDVVVTTDYAGGNTEVFYQNAGGTLDPPAVVDAAGRMVRVADINGDTRGDLVVFSYEGLRIRRQLVNGTLAAIGPLNIAGFTGLGEIGDWNRDGRNDIAVIKDDKSVAVMIQQANGTLAAPVTLATFATQPIQVRMVDLDGDLRTDLAVTDGSTAVTIRAQLPGGSLAAPTTVTSPSAMRDFVVGDFNGDSRLDLATSHGFNGNSYVIYRNADLSWGAAVGLTEPGDGVYYTAVRTGDVDGDGTLDLVVVKSHNDTLVYLQGPGGLSTTPIRPYHSVMQWPSAQNGWVADISGDGAPDLLSAAYYGPLSVSINTTPTTVSGLRGLVTGDPGLALAGIEVEAFDGDGNAVASTTTDGLGRYLLSYRVLDPTASYTLRFTDPVGVRPTVWYATSGPVVGSAQATPLSFTLGSTTTADIAIPEFVGASGRVEDGHGSGVGGVEVSVTAAGEDTPVAQTTTGPAGDFELDDLVPGDYVIALHDPSLDHEDEWWGEPGRPRTGAGTPLAIEEENTDLGDHVIGSAACATATIAPGEDLDLVDLSGCWLPHAQLAGASLGLTDLAGATLTEADLSGASMATTDLSHADLFLARLAGSNRTTVVYDDTTCPDGTNSDAHGETCEGHLGNPVGTDDPVGAVLDIAPGASLDVTGWALDPNTVDPIHVAVTIDGGNPVEVVADLPSVESEAAHPDYGADHGFHASLPAVPPGIHEVCVTARNTGPGDDVELSCEVVDAPVVDTRYTALTPARILDSRTGLGTGTTTPIGPAGSIDLQVTGRGGVPANHVGAVVLNLTATDPTAATFLTVHPTGTSRPIASNLNVVAGQTDPNLVVAKVGANGKIRIFNAEGSVHVVADVAGYFDDGTQGGASFHPAPPTRVLDTRIGTGGTTGPIGPGGVVHLQVGGNNGVPLGTTRAVVLNVTATETTEPSFLTVYPTGTPKPATSNLNFAAGETIPNLVIATVSPDGWIDIANSSGSTQVVADLAGWFESTPSGSRYNPLTPSRILDTRVGTGGPVQPVGPGATIHVRAADVGGVPAGASAVVLNVTATNPTAQTFLTVFPTGTPRPTASNLNLQPGQTIPNLVIAKVSPDGWIDIFNVDGTVEVVADVQGWFE